MRNPARLGKVDSTQAEVVKAFETAGFSILGLTGVGSGCPDLAVGYGGKTYWIEVKSARGKQNRVQTKWAAQWKGGPVYIIRSGDSAWTMANLIRKEQFAA